MTLQFPTRAERTGRQRQIASLEAQVWPEFSRDVRVDAGESILTLHRPNAHATISGNSSCQNASPCDPTRSVMTTSAPASRSAVRPSGGVLEEERLQGAGDEVRARKRARHNARRPVTAARRGAEDRAVDIWMPKPEGEGQLSTRRDAEHRGTFGGQRRRRNATRAHRRTSSTKNFSCAANRSGSKPGEYSWSRSVSSASRCTPTIIVDGTSAASSDPPHCEIS